MRHQRVDVKTEQSRREEPQAAFGFGLAKGHGSHAQSCAQGPMRMVAFLLHWRFHLSLCVCISIVPFCMSLMPSWLCYRINCHFPGCGRPRSPSAVSTALHLSPVVLQAAVADNHHLSLNMLCVLPVGILLHAHSIMHSSIRPDFFHCFFFPFIPSNLF